MQSRIARAALALTLAAGAVLMHSAGALAQSTKILNVEITDNLQLKPAQLDVSQGDMVRMTIKNSSDGQRECVLGTEGELRQHALIMAHNEALSSVGAGGFAPGMTQISPGESGTLLWQASTPGKRVLACNEIGHLAVDTKSTVTVHPARR